MIVNKNKKDLAWKIFTNGKPEVLFIFYFIFFNLIMSVSSGSLGVMVKELSVIVYL